MYRLTVYQGETLIQVQDFDQPYVTMGRHRYAQVILNNRQVSRRHAQLKADHHGVWIKEFGKTNGIFVNTQRITEETLLRHDDQLQIGPFVIVFQEAGPNGQFAVPIEELLAQTYDGSEGEEEASAPEVMVDDGPTSFVSLADFAALGLGGAAAAPASAPTPRKAKKKRYPAHVKIISDRLPRVYPLFRRVTEVGTSASANVPIFGGWFTPKSCAEISKDEDGNFILNKTSMFARVFVNGKKTKHRVLKNKDVIRIAHTEIQYFAKVE